MKFNTICVILILVILHGNDCEGKGGGGGGGGGRGGGGGGGRGGGGRSGSVGKSSGGKLSTGKKVGLITAGGVASYAAYRGYKNAHPKNKDRDRDSQDFDADADWNGDYQVQERTQYSRGEGGMSAVAIIFLVLAIIGFGSALWCFYNIGLPCWRDRQSRRNRTLNFPHVIPIKGDDIPLHDTPTTATPSPK